MHQLRQALDLLWGQSETDGCEPFACIGRMKVELINLEEGLREAVRRPSAERRWRAIQRLMDVTPTDYEEVYLKIAHPIQLKSTPKK